METETGVGVTENLPPPRPCQVCGAGVGVSPKKFIDSAALSIEVNYGVEGIVIRLPSKKKERKKTDRRSISPVQWLLLYKPLKIVTGRAAHTKIFFPF